MSVIPIALNTFKEAIRDRILYTILAFALALIGSSVVLASLSVGGEEKIIKDLGLASILIFGTFIAIFIGIGLVSKEIDKRTIYTIIAKPIHRYEFILGKYLGLLLTLLVNVSAMAVGFFLLVSLMEEGGSFGLLPAVLLIFVELMLMTAVAILFSSFTTPTLSAVFTLSVFVIGHLSRDLKEFAAQFGGPVLNAVVFALYYLLPNLSNFNIKGQAVHGVPVPMSFIALSVLYGALYLSALLVLAMLIFQRRDFK
ncbi:MAG: ABC transporter permease [Candidatus Methylomirabilales bacterium]